MNIPLQIVLIITEALDSDWLLIMIYEYWLLCSIPFVTLGETIFNIKFMWMEWNARRKTLDAINDERWRLYRLYRQIESSISEMKRVSPLWSPRWGFLRCVLRPHQYHSKWIMLNNDSQLPSSLKLQHGPWSFQNRTGRMACIIFAVRWYTAILIVNIHLFIFKSFQSQIWN